MPGTKSLAFAAPLTWQLPQLRPARRARRRRCRRAEGEIAEIDQIGFAAARLRCGRAPRPVERLLVEVGARGQHGLIAVIGNDAASRGEEPEWPEVSAESRPAGSLGGPRGSGVEPDFRRRRLERDHQILAFRAQASASSV